VLPLRDGQEMEDLAAFLDTYRQQGPLVVPTGQRPLFRGGVYTVLVYVVGALRGGEVFTVAPVFGAAGHPQAADLIGVFRRDRGETI
jgi:hypothetical protein